MHTSSTFATERGHEEATDGQPGTTDGTAATRLLTIALVLLLITQRLSIPLGSFPIPLAVPIVFMLFAWGFYRGYFAIDSRRMLAYLAAISCLLVSSLAVSTEGMFSPFSLTYLVGLYAVFVIVSPRCDLQSLYHSHQTAMVGFAVLGIAQFLVQLGGMPFIDPLSKLHQMFSLPGYNTVQPLSFGADMIKSNAICFLEASHLSKALAVAILIELLYFRRISYIVLYCCCYGFTFSGTGAIALAVGLATGIRYIPKSWILGSVLLGIIAAGAVTAAGVADVWVNRTSEFNNIDSSGTIRFVTPYTRIWEVLKHDFQFFGRGAGSVEESFTIVGGVEAFDPTPVKLIYEYGPVSAAVFMCFILYCLYTGTARSPLKHACAVVLFFLTGGLLEAVTLFYCYIMAGMVVGESKSPERHTVPNHAIVRSLRLKTSPQGS